MLVCNQVWLHLSRCARVCFLLLMSAGCSGSQDIVDTDAAVQTLQSTLEAWKNGQSPTDLKSAAEPVVVQDPDWSNGAKLEAYEIIGEAKAEGPNLRCDVVLTLQRPGDKPVRTDAQYTVTTSPSRTVFRNLF